MIPLDGLIQTAINIFAHTITVIDTEYTKISGVDTRATVATRTISGAIDPGNSEAVRRALGGSIAEGDITILSAGLLYIDDMYDPDSSTLTRLQSFVQYRGIYYRVKQKTDWVQHTGTKIYVCGRYFDQEIELP